MDIIRNKRNTFQNTTPESGNPILPEVYSGYWIDTHFLAISILLLPTAAILTIITSSPRAIVADSNQELLMRK
jgi:hypothetical protein